MRAGLQTGWESCSLSEIWPKKLKKRPVTKQDEGGKQKLQAAVFKYPEMQDFSFKDMQDTLSLSLVW